MLLEILRLAAPRVLHTVKPAFPPGADEADFTAEERADLFST